MSDYIKIEKVLELLAGVVAEIIKMPPEEPEVIRCKNCKYYDGRPCGNVDWYNTDSDYCSRAEGRTDE